MKIPKVLERGGHHFKLQFSWIVMDMTFNNSRTVYDGKHHTSSVITAVCLIVISIIAFGGNLLVLAAICINRNLRSVSDLFVANLAVADLCQAVVAIPLRVTILLGEARQTPFIPCHVVVLFTILFGGASNVNILLLSVDRFIAIKWPFKYNSWVTVKLFISALVLSWLSLFLVAILPLLGWGRAENVALSPTCRFSVTLERDYVVTCYILIHGIPLTTILVIYLFILKATFRHSRAIAAQELSLRTNNSPAINNHSITNEEMSTNDEQQQQRKRGNLSLRMRARNSSRRSKGARMVAVLVGVFIILVLPIIVIDVVEIWQEPFAPPAVVNVAICLIYANSGVNVFLYAGWNTEYRRTFRLVLVSLWKLVKKPCS